MFGSTSNHREKTPERDADIESGSGNASGGDDTGKHFGSRELSSKVYDGSIWARFATFGVELRGITPVAVEDRKDGRYINIFTIWFSMSVNILAIVTGMTGTLVFGMNLRDSSLTILFFSLLCSIPPSYLSTLGPKTGLRQMIQARYSFGYFPGLVVVLLNVATITGFVVVSCVIGGQTLAAISSGNVSWNVGIVIIALLGLLLSLFGYKILHLYERYCWLFALAAIIIMTGVGGKKLHIRADAPPANAPLVLTFASLIAGYLITWGGLSSDISTYIRPDAPAWRIFWYTYIPLTLPTIVLMILGAAIGASVPAIPEWSAANDANSSGGVLAAMLEPAGGFGKFVVVLLAFSILGNVAASLYAITLNLQILLGGGSARFIRYVPRFVFSIAMTAVIIPVSIEAAKNFFENLENFLGLIGYWAAAFVAVVVTEHVVFRRRDASTYRHEMWDDWRKLPTGWAGFAAGFVSLAACAVPSMAQVWYVGPIGKKTGDIGFELVFVSAVLLYLLFRWVDLRFLQGRL